MAEREPARHALELECRVGERGMHASSTPSEAVASGRGETGSGKQQNENSLHAATPGFRESSREKG